ncbi:MAG: DUF4296 domain-containing protein [Bacteroidales bacterium]|nr:DUF4296 domain-containing protein [Bacteroidales bacterium]
MKKTFLYILLIPLVLFSAGCHKKQVQKRPDNLINRSTMANILAEAYIIESLITLNPDDTLNNVESARGYYHDLFERYHVTREQFNTSMQYYMGDEDAAKKLVIDANAILMAKKKELAITDTLPPVDPDAIDIVDMDQTYQEQTPQNAPAPEQ